MVPAGLAMPYTSLSVHHYNYDDIGHVLLDNRLHPVVNLLAFGISNELLHDVVGPARVWCQYSPPLVLNSQRSFLRTVPNLFFCGSRVSAQGVAGILIRAIQLKNQLPNGAASEHQMVKVLLLSKEMPVPTDIDHVIDQHAGQSEAESAPESDSDSDSESQQRRSLIFYGTTLHVSWKTYRDAVISDHDAILQVWSNIKRSLQVQQLLSGCQIRRC